MYTTEGKIRFSEVDTGKAVTLPSIINYFQDCSIFQSEDIGLGFQFLETRRRAWVLSSWQIEIKRYPLLGERIRTGTWANGFEGLYGGRNFVLYDEQGRQAAYANSLWVLMDMDAGRPVRPAAEDIEGYEVLPPIEMEKVSRKIKRPESLLPLESFPVRKYHIDTNSHVNNCQYVQMAQEVLPQAMCISRVRVEYKYAAVYGDVIYPQIAVEEDRTVVELCNMEGRPYAVVEFRGEK